MEKKIKKIIAGILTTAVCVSTSVCAFVACDERKESEREETYASSGLVVEEQKKHGISLSMRRVSSKKLASYASSEYVTEMDYSDFPYLRESPVSEIPVGEEYIYKIHCPDIRSEYVSNGGDLDCISDYVTTISFSSGSESEDICFIKGVACSAEYLHSRNFPTDEYKNYYDVLSYDEENEVVYLRFKNLAEFFAEDATAKIHFDLQSESYVCFPLYASFSTYALNDQLYYDGVLVSYEITPSYATTKDLEFSLSWSKEAVDDPGSDYHSSFYAEMWAEAMKTSDYIGIHLVGSGNFLVGLKNKYFSFPIDLTVKVAGTEVSATLRIDYELRASETYFSWCFGSYSDGGYVSGTMDYDVSEYDGYVPSDADIDVVGLLKSSFSEKRCFSFEVGSISLYKDNYGDYHPYSKLGEYSYRVSLSEDWCNMLAFAEQYGFNVTDVADYSDFRLEDYEIRSLGALIVAPTVNDSLWPTLFEMSLDELLAEYPEEFAYYRYVCENIFVCPVFVVSACDKYSSEDSGYVLDYVALRYQDIEIVADSISVLKSELIF